MRNHTTAADYPRDFAFDDEVQERPARDRSAFLDIRPLAEVKARQAALAAEFDRLAASRQPAAVHSTPWSPEDATDLVRRVVGEFAPFVHDPTPDQRAAWGLDARETVLVRWDGVWAGGTVRHPTARQVAGEDAAAMLAALRE